MKILAIPEEWLVEAEEVATGQPADITKVPITTALAFGFLQLSIGEGSLYFRKAKYPVKDGWRLSPMAQITMSEKEYMTCWGKRLGVSVFKLRKKPEILKLFGRVIKFTKPVYALYKSGTLLQRIFIEARKVPMADCIFGAVPEVRAILELGSFVVPLKPEPRSYYSLIDPAEREELYRLRERAIRVVPVPERIRYKVAPEDEKRMVMLRKLGYTLEEIGELTGFDLSTVGKVLKRVGYE